MSHTTGKDLNPLIWKGDLSVLESAQQLYYSNQLGYTSYLSVQYSYRNRVDCQFRLVQQLVPMIEAAKLLLASIEDSFTLEKADKADILSTIMWHLSRNQKPQRDWLRAFALQQYRVHSSTADRIHNLSVSERRTALQQVPIIRAVLRGMVVDLTRACLANHYPPKGAHTEALLCTTACYVHPLRKERRRLIDRTIAAAPQVQDKNQKVRVLKRIAYALLRRGNPGGVWYGLRAVSVTDVPMAVRKKLLS